jgi:hypothetical protein
MKTLREPSVGASSTPKRGLKLSRGHSSLRGNRNLKARLTRRNTSIYPTIRSQRRTLKRIMRKIRRVMMTLGPVKSTTAVHSIMKHTRWILAAACIISPSPTCPPNMAARTSIVCISTKKREAGAPKIHPFVSKRIGSRRMSCAGLSPAGIRMTSITTLTTKLRHLRKSSS